MPPKVKHTPEDIISTAYRIVQNEGKSALTARSLAKALRTSTAPIFTAFESIDALTDAVFARAKALYDSYLTEGLTHSIPFKGAGLAHVRFAMDEPNLFRFLFVECKETEPLRHYLPIEDENEQRVRQALEHSYGYDSEKAKRIYNHLSVYVHGLAMLYAYGHDVFCDEDLEKMLSEVFLALKENLSGGQNEIGN